jgi:chloramphenicol 3-O phosphotransferase
MTAFPLPGQIVILNGAPRSGKSSIVTAIQESFTGTWMNLGVDVARRMTPPRAQPGIGLRPGEAAHQAAPFVPLLYAALYESVASHSKLGLNVAVDVGHYDAKILSDSARRLVELPVLFVGVHCPIEVIMERRRDSEPGRYVVAQVSDAIPAPVLLWQDHVHEQWTYDLEVDTSVQSPQQCAAAIRRRLDSGVCATEFARLADNDRRAS